MEKNSDGAWALVTGASGGMGADFARLLSQRGYNLVLTARSTEKLEALKSEIEEKHSERQIRIIAGDLSRRESRDSLIAACKDLPVEVLINNAGVGAYGAFDDVSEAAEDAMLDLDIKALVHLTRTFAQMMKVRGKGWILETASIAAFQPCPLFATYAAAKAFVLSYGIAARTELRGTGVNVTVLCPGVTETGFFDAANQKKLSAFQKSSMMASETVVKGALGALFARKAVYTPGVINRANAILARLVPRTLSATMAGNLAR